MFIAKEIVQHNLKPEHTETKLEEILPTKYLCLKLLYSGVTVFWQEDEHKLIKEQVNKNC